MKLNYTKISQTLYKFFYEEDGKYGEFYIEITPDKLENGKPSIVNGTAEIFGKSNEYNPVLVAAFKEALEVSNGKN